MGWRNIAITLIEQVLLCLVDGRLTGNNPESQKLSGQVPVNGLTAEVGTNPTTMTSSQRWNLRWTLIGFQA